jgi:hypothetical protein
MEFVSILLLCRGLCNTLSIALIVTDIEAITAGANR